jgi:hypothetical protein
VTLRLWEVVSDVSKDRVVFMFRDYCFMDLEASDAASQPRRPQSSITRLWKPKTQQTEFYCFIVGWQAILLLPFLLFGYPSDFLTEIREDKQNK